MEVTALDLSESGLEHLKKWARKEKLDVSSVCANMMKLPFEDNAFDCIMCYNVIYHTDSEGIKRAVYEAKRVLRPGGELFLTMISNEGWENALKRSKQLDAKTL